MFLFIKYNDEVTSLHVRLLVALTTEYNLLAISHAFVNVNFDDLAVPDSFPPLKIYVYNVSIVH